MASRHTRGKSNLTQDSSSPDTPSKSTKKPASTSTILLNSVADLSKTVEGLSYKLDEVLKLVSNSSSEKIDTILKQLASQQKSLDSTKTEVSQMHEIVWKKDDQFATTEPNPVVTANQIKLNEISDMLLKEKRSSITRENCIALKRTISLLWADSLNKRKQSFWHHLQNRSKADLYTAWIGTSPEYLPLKFRPKNIPGEIEVAKNNRIAEAKLSYTNSVATMRAYAQKHQESYEELDTMILSRINTMTGSHEEKDLLIKWWQEDTGKNEMISLQLWQKHESFLSTKKNDDEAKGIYNLTDTLWADIVQSKPAKKGNRKPMPNQLPSPHNEDPTFSTQISHRDQPKQFTKAPPANKLKGYSNPNQNKGNKRQKHFGSKQNNPFSRLNKPPAKIFGPPEGIPEPSFNHMSAASQPPKLVPREQRLVNPFAAPQQPPEHFFNNGYGTTFNQWPVINPSQQQSNFNGYQVSSPLPQRDRFLYQLPGYSQHL